MQVPGEGCDVDTAELLEGITQSAYRCRGAE
jgi:hypothetical protein